MVYAVNETDTGAVRAWSIPSLEHDEPPVLLGAATTGGSLPCHVAVHPDGWLITAEYGSGTMCVHQLDEIGAPVWRTDTVQHHADRGEAHAHMAHIQPDGSVLAVDLGADAVFRYTVSEDGRLVAAGARAMPPGSGPRHLVVVDGVAHVLGEYDACVTSYRLSDGAHLSRVPVTISSAECHPSEILASPDGRFLYVANRGPDTVAVLALDGDCPRFVGEVPAGGHWPRHLALIGDHLYVANQHSHAVAVLRIDPATGIPETAGPALAVPSPACVLAL